MPKKMLQVCANQGEGTLDIPLDSKLTISYRNKNGEENVARISNSIKANTFVALFEDDDVDFKIRMENSTMDRTLCFDVNILRERYGGFLVNPNSRCSMETLISNGKKLHFISQSGKQGKQLVAATATCHRLNREGASKLLSSIKFNVTYSLPPEYNIYVKTENGEKMSLSVTRLDTVADVKKKMKEYEGFTCSLIQFKGNRLEDNKSMETLSITEHSILQVSGTVISIEVKVLTSKSLRLTVNSTDTVKYLKMKMEAQQGIPLNQQCMYFRGDKLPDYECMEYIGIEEGSKVFLHVNLQNCPNNDSKRFKRSHECSPTQIFPVKAQLSFRKTITVNACAEETIQELKVKFQEKDVSLGANPNNIELYNNHGRLEKFLTLEVYDINENVELRMATFCTQEHHFCSGQSQVVFVKLLTGKTVTFTYCGLDKVEALKQKIEMKAGILVDQQRLIFCGNQFEDGRLLNDYFLRSESTLHLCLRVRGGGGQISNQQGNTLQLSERGAITFGDTSQQTFGIATRRFFADSKIRIKPFTVELHLAAVPRMF